MNGPSSPGTDWAENAHYIRLQKDGKGVVHNVWTKIVTIQRDFGLIRGSSRRRLSDEARGTPACE
jgi:hypothetical protein